MQFKKFIKGETNNLENIKKDDYVESMNFLIEDENEAISGYDKIILLVENGDHLKKEEILKELHFIRNQEINHIEKLKELLKLL